MGAPVKSCPDTRQVDLVFVRHCLDQEVLWGTLRLLRTSESNAKQAGMGSISLFAQPEALVVAAAG